MSLEYAIEYTIYEVCDSSGFEIETQEYFLFEYEYIHLKPKTKKKKKKKKKERIIYNK